MPTSRSAWARAELSGQKFRWMGRCQSCRVKLECDQGADASIPGRQAHPLNASPDRLNNSIGYVDGNVRWMCVACNLMRRNNSVQGVKDHVARMTEVWRAGKVGVDGKGNLVPKLDEMDKVKPTQTEEGTIK